MTNHKRTLWWDLIIVCNLQHVAKKGTFRVDSYSFCSVNLKFYCPSLWHRLNQWTYFLYWLFGDKIAYSMWHIIRCHIFVIKQPVQQKWKSIDRVYIKVIHCRIWDRKDKMSMNRLLVFNLNKLLAVDC